MTATFKEVRKLQGERVRMSFDDGREVVAQLLCATRDMDGSKHLIYNKVESGPAEEMGSTGCFYADAKALVHIEHADAKRQADGPRGRNPLAMRSPMDVDSLKTWRPGA
jgi:hypothetical protein